ncbi:MAG TPA: FAD:protein FMN transferase [Thermoanaerobaculia bacterium]|nr:FAD:protein FMN transferase [Thermoanaerobaculia bacterium]
MRLSLNYCVGLSLAIATATATVTAPLAFARRTAALAASAEPRAVERRVAVMGTLFGIEVRSTSREAALSASEAALEAVESAEALLSTWRSGTPLSRLNAAPVGKPEPLPAALVRALHEVFAISARTEGAFQPGILPLVRAWGLRSGGRVPGADELERARRASSLGGFDVDLERSTATRLRADAAIDEGAWGKGWARDRAGAALEASGSSGLLDLGGQLLAVGGGERIVDVAHPTDRSRTVLKLRLRQASASTSGNSERSVKTAGVVVGHLLDPRSGRPAPDFGSVTVVASSALVADALSTALYVLGPEEGLAISRRLRSEGLAHEAIFLVAKNGGVHALFSAGAKSLVLEGDVECP